VVLGCTAIESSSSSVLGYRKKHQQFTAQASERAKVGPKKKKKRKKRKRKRLHRREEGRTSKA
jgi:hypothetical protein